MAQRSKTLTLSFAHGRKPSWEVLFKFIEEELCVKKSDLYCVQEEVGEPHVHLKFRVFETFRACALDIEPKVRFLLEFDGIVAYVYITLNGEKVRNVRLRNLPPEATSEQVLEAMSRYGTAVFDEPERFKTGPFAGLRNGNRIVTMLRFDYVPNYIHILGHEVIVDYRGQPKTCRKCGGVGHLQAACGQPAEADDSDADPEPAEEEGEEGEQPPPQRAASEPPPVTTSADVTRTPPGHVQADDNSPLGNTTSAKTIEHPAVSPGTGEDAARERTTYEEEWKIIKEIARSRSSSRKRQASGSPEIRNGGPNTRSRKKK